MLYIYDALYKQDTMQHVLVRHEQAAVHAADGYARATGDVGVALVTSGPGVTNAVTGIATAYMDSIPMVIITGQVPTPAIGLDAFQECDTVGITRPIVKHNFLVKDVRDLAVTVKKAFHIARTGRPGPVVVDIPKDVSLKTAPFAYPESVAMRSYNPVRKGHSGQIRKAVQLLLAAKRPYIYTGGGVILGNASSELRQLADLLGYPCTNTLMGLGAIAASDPKFLGMLGMHGTYEANMTMQNADVVIAVGARFDDRVIGNPKHFAQVERKIIHIDIDPSSISKRRARRHPDRRRHEGRAAGADHADPRGAVQARRGGDLGRGGARSTSGGGASASAYKPSSEVIKPQMVVDKLWQARRAGATSTSRPTSVSTRCGPRSITASREPRDCWINSGGLGTMGVGLPYAMGIKLAKPDADVFCITGEGSIQMCLQELSTCLQYKTPVKIVSLNNRYLGMVRQWQQLNHGGRYSLYSYMDGAARFREARRRAYGHVGILVEKPGDVEPALKEAIRLKDRTVFLDIRTDPTENVWPMVKAGQGITEMLLGSEDL